MIRLAIVILLLACCAFAHADGVRAAIEFADPTMSIATLALTNDTAEKITLVKPYRAIYTRELTFTVKTAAGAVIPPHQTICKMFGPLRDEDLFHLPARSTQRLDIPVAPFHLLERGRLYLVTLSYQTQQGHTVSLTFPYGLPAEQVKPDEFVSAWSKEVDHTQARIRLVPQESITEGRTARYCELYLDLRNTLAQELTVNQQPKLSLQVFDGEGRPVPAATLVVMSGPPIAAPRALIPMASVISYRLDATTAGMPVNGTTMVSTAYPSTGFHGIWNLPPGRYTVKGVATITALERVIPPIEIPAVEIIVQPLAEKLF